MSPEHFLSIIRSFWRSARAIIFSKKNERLRYRSITFLLLVVINIFVYLNAVHSQKSTKLSFLSLDSCDFDSTFLRNNSFSNGVGPSIVFYRGAPVRKCDFRRETNTLQGITVIDTVKVYVFVNQVKFPSEVTKPLRELNPTQRLFFSDHELRVEKISPTHFSVIIDPNVLIDLNIPGDVNRQNHALSWGKAVLQRSNVAQAL